MPKKIDPLKKERAKSLYASGLSAMEVASQTGLNVHTLTSWCDRENWRQLRQLVDTKSESLLVDRIAEDKAKATLDIINPLVSQLTVLAEEVLNKNKDELRAKDVLHPLGTMLRLRSRLKGEITNKHEINSNTALFVQILRAAEKIDPSTIQNTEWDLIG